MSRKKLIVATGNENKAREFREILDEDKFEIVTMKEAGIDVEIVEDGQTFLENAIIKAKTVANECDAIVVADDSGLEVDALGGEPGIYSARYMGEDTPYDIKNAEIIKRLDGVPKSERTARFVCAMAAVMQDGEVLTVQGTIEGYIGYEPVGENGFGYDPIFYVDKYGTSTANISPEQKNEISHRGQALRAIKEKIENYE